MWFKTAIVVAVVHFVAVIALWLYMFTGIGAAKPSPRALAAGSVLGILVFPVPLLSSLLWGAAAGTAWVTLRVVLAFGRRVLFRRPA